MTVGDKFTLIDYAVTCHFVRMILHDT